MKASELYPEHLQDLKSGSGLSDEIIELMGVRSIYQQDIQKLSDGGLAGVNSALEFPYHGLEGFSRCKLFPPLIGKDGHSIKYFQKKNSGSHLYILPPIRAVLADISKELVIVEGEKKAAAGIQAGLNCIAIGGLWNWMNSQTGEAIEEFNAIAWAERDALIVPDSDVWVRPDLQKAVYALGMEIQSRGALVRVLLLPQEKDKKVGLDDFFLKNSLESFNNLKRVKLTHPALAKHRDWQKKWKQRKTNNVANVQQEPSKKSISDEERQEAMNLLQQNNLILKFLDDTERLRCVGEKDNKVALFLALTSRKLEQPINVTMKGESSAGKNFLVNAVSKFFPPEDIQLLSSATRKAFFYLANDLSHKFIILAEAPGAEEADYSIRTFQSEGEIAILVPEKDNTGRRETKERRVKGPVGFIQTTTKSHLHQENETRTFDLYVDEGDEQTEAIFKAQNEKYLGISSPLSVTRVWQNAQRLLESLPVLIPYVEAIEFPTKPLRVRRDRPRFLAFIEASAILHQYQRERETINGHDFIVATLEDYEIARELGAAILGQVLKGATPRCEALLEVTSGFQKDFSRADIEEKLKWNRKTVGKYLDEAVDLGCLDIIQQGEGLATMYRFVKKLQDASCVLLTKEEIEEKVSKLSLAGEIHVGQVKSVKILTNTKVVQTIHLEEDGH